MTPGCRTCAQGMARDGQSVVRHGVVVRSAIALIVVLSAFTPLGTNSAAAQDIEPRAFTPAPIGTNVAGLTYLHSWGAVLVDDP